ncbi:MAG TPA: WhiB family transcriptional regulator [Candidatus Saccharibacteria bacterium]|jgi:WhiB family redox-sensing transcriptional regulator|nr:WhiB family transcriptional regulator [Candidatus Saccharibacteria bacterium]HMT56191.1 WhiB family transcriptional regulator [Candidatus Saccharibacteria bacterium]
MNEAEGELQKNWQEEANCSGVDPNLFFPEQGASSRDAKEICAGCIVRLECLDYALTHREKAGIWGGETERGRRRILKNRALAARKVTE